jgi:WD40 repeat protein
MQPRRTYNLRFLAAKPILAAAPPQRIPTNRSPIQLGVFVALALNAGKPTSRALIARIAYGQDYTPATYDASIETAVSRLRRECGLPISEGDYLLDMDPDEIDLLDFQARAGALIDASTGARGVPSSATDLDALVSEGLDLQSVWEYDPRSYFAKRPSIAAIFDSHVKRHVRFGRTLIGLLQAVGHPGTAEEVHASFASMYPQEVWDPPAAQAETIRRQGPGEPPKIETTTLKPRREHHVGPRIRVLTSVGDREYASADYSGEVRRWSSLTPDNALLFSVGFPVRALLRLPDDHWITAGHHRTVTVWHAGELVRELIGHTDWVLALAALDDGQRVASGSDDTTIRIWDLATGRCERVLEGHEGWVRALVVLGDGQRLASGSDDTTIRIWDLATGRCERVLEGHEGWVRALALHPDTGDVLSASGDRTIRFWSGSRASGQITLDDRPRALIVQRHELLAAGDDGHIWCFDLLHSASGTPAHGSAVASLRSGPDSTSVISLSVDGSVALLDASSQSEVARWSFDDDRATAAELSSDGSLFLGTEKGHVMGASTSDADLVHVGQFGSPISQLVASARHLVVLTGEGGVFVVSEPRSSRRSVAVAGDGPTITRSIAAVGATLVVGQDDGSVRFLTFPDQDR